MRLTARCAVRLGHGIGVGIGALTVVAGPAATGPRLAGRRPRAAAPARWANPWVPIGPAERVFGSASARSGAAPTGSVSGSASGARLRVAGPQTAALTARQPLAHPNGNPVREADRAVRLQSGCGSGESFAGGRRSERVRTGPAGRVQAAVSVMPSPAGSVRAGPGVRLGVRAEAASGRPVALEVAGTKDVNADLLSVTASDLPVAAQGPPWTGIAVACAFLRPTTRGGAPRTWAAPAVRPLRSGSAPITVTDLARPDHPSATVALTVVR
jgi:hypothetical protein